GGGEDRVHAVCGGHLGVLLAVGGGVPDVRGHCAQLDRLAEHVTSFAKMMTKRTGQQDLPGWLERVDADNQPELHTFAAGIRQDLAAVTPGLSLPYSSGPTEGNVNRLTR